MALEQSWRWYGPDDPVSLADIRMAGAAGIVTALHQVPIGELWPIEEIQARKARIEAAGLSWSVVESIPVHEDIKLRRGDYATLVANYQENIRRLGAVGIDTVCYNFMPILDWTRTDLAYPMPDGSTALRFDLLEFAAFELFLLERPGAGEDYNDEQQAAARRIHDGWSIAQRERIVRTIIAGLPGAHDGYNLEQFRARLADYAGVSSEQLRENLYTFIRQITPVAEAAGVRLAIHPDDPPFPILGLPRVVSTEADAAAVLAAHASPHNGLCFCTGSYGVRPDNDLPGMVQRLGDRINFIHLRSTARDPAPGERNFHEADHLDGDVDMFAVMRALLAEQRRRKEGGRTDYRLPMRPDHGHQMLDDLGKQVNPGYSAIGRLRGLAELRGLMLGIERSRN